MGFFNERIISYFLHLKIIKPQNFYTMGSFRPLILALFLVWITFSGFGQERDYGQWINFGGNHTSKWLQIAPGQLALTHSLCREWITPKLAK
jgi:hypothetical protein